MQVDAPGGRQQQAAKAAAGHRRPVGFENVSTTCMLLRSPHCLPVQAPADDDECSEAFLTSFLSKFIALRDSADADEYSSSEDDDVSEDELDDKMHTVDEEETGDRKVLSAMPCLPALSCLLCLIRKMQAHHAFASAGSERRSIMFARKQRQSPWMQIEPVWVRRRTPQCQ